MYSSLRACEYSRVSFDSIGEAVFPAAAASPGFPYFQAPTGPGVSAPVGPPPAPQETVQTPPAPTPGQLRTSPKHPFLEKRGVEGDNNTTAPVPEVKQESGRKLKNLLVSYSQKRRKAAREREVTAVIKKRENRVSQRKSHQSGPPVARGSRRRRAAPPVREEIRREISLSAPQRKKRRRRKEKATKRQDGRREAGLPV